MGKAPCVCAFYIFKTTEKELIKNGFQIVIYANHMLRAAYPAMQNAALEILKNQRSYELEKKISSVSEGN